MPYKFVDEKDAPPAPKKTGSSKAKMFIELIETLPEGKVAEIDPEEGQSVRGIKVSVGRVASTRGITIQSWDSDGKVYVKKTGTKDKA